MQGAQVRDLRALSDCLMRDALAAQRAGHQQRVAARQTDALLASCRA